MQQKFTTFKLIFIGLLVILGVGFAQAWTAPTATAPGNNTPGPLNSGDTAQGLPYSAATDKKISLYIKTQNTSDVALLADGGFSSAGQIEADGKLLVDLSGDSSGNTSDTRDVLHLYSGDNSPTASNIVVDKSKFTFWSTLTSALASVRAGLGLSDSTVVGGTTSRSTTYTLDLSGTTNIGIGDTCTLITTSDRDVGCPLGSAIISVDKNAAKGYYGICRFYNPKDTPTDLGGCYGIVPPVDLCPNLAGNQSSVPYGYTLNTTSGDCDRYYDVSVTDTLFGITLTDVTGVSGFTFDKTNPIGPGEKQEGYHTAFTGTVTVAASGVASAIDGNITISKNSVPVKCVNVLKGTTAPATVTTTSISFIPGDIIGFGGNTGRCP